MIEHLQRSRFTARTHHLASLASDEATLRGMGVDDPTAMIEFVKAARRGDDPNGYLDRPFQSKPQFPYQTRFSDGIASVFYSAIELETSKAEVAYHAPVRILSAGHPVFYREVQANFTGETKDLRGELATLPYLIANREDGGYDQCNKIASEARTEGLDALLTPSARRAGADCLPVFVRVTLSNPVAGQWLMFSLDAATGAVQVTEADPIP